MSSTKRDDVEPAIHEADYLKGWRLGAVGTSIVLSMFLASLDLVTKFPFTGGKTRYADETLKTIIATAIPQITDDFHSLSDVGWYASALFLTVAAAQSVWGKAFKYFPVKTVYLLSIAVFEVGSIICGVAQNSTTLIVGRAVTGLGVAGTFGGSYIIIGISAPPEQRPAMTGFMGSAYAIASVIGPSTVKPTEATLKEKLKQMDIPGFLLATSAVVCYLLAMQWGGVTKTWGSSDVVGTLVGSIVLFIAFLVVEWYQGERALLVPSILKNGTIARGCAFSFLIAGNFYILLYYLPIYFQSVRGASATDSGIRTLPLILGLRVSVGAFKVFNPFLITGGILTTIATGLMTLLEVDSDHSVWIGYQALAGIGLGLCFNVYIIIVQNIVEPDEVATATAILLCMSFNLSSIYPPQLYTDIQAVFQSLGGALVVSAAQSLFQNELLNSLAITSPNINPATIFAIGASDLQSTFSKEELRGINASYTKALHMAFTMAIPMSGVATLVAVSQNWFRLKVPGGEILGTNGNDVEKNA
ncbi:hypothetical protein HYFRA_00009021 [Hymenoscyphus fraxineus]|uniref:Major facilitator superfamily (MFS) profile domain-containing protein n=1 Tax=Hymenoscyphus fraxineus TaxID=746836 RepID=A0A9N9PMV4_9HELO|nr:hypothetical protein HYFRA_00009021 [Hymenoscyphus fraxineus]